MNTKQKFRPEQGPCGSARSQDQPGAVNGEWALRESQGSRDLFRPARGHVEYTIEGRFKGALGQFTPRRAVRHVPGNDARDKSTADFQFLVPRAARHRNLNPRNVEGTRILMAWKTEMKAQPPPLAIGG